MHGVFTFTPLLDSHEQFEYKLRGSMVYLCGGWRVGQMEVSSGNMCPPTLPLKCDPYLFMEKRSVFDRFSNYQSYLQEDFREHHGGHAQNF